MYPLKTPVDASECSVILLVQFTEQPSSKSYVQLSNPEALVETILHMYELQLRAQNVELVGTAKIVYDYKDVLLFLDGLTSLIVLILDKNSHHFIPHDLEWVKLQLLSSIQGQSV